MQRHSTVGTRRAWRRYAWAFPATFLGLVLAAIDRAGGGSLHVIDGVLEAGGGAVGRALRHLPPPWRFSAITLGHVIIGVDRDALAECRLHERVHVRQYERWGVFFFPLYFASSAWQILRRRDPYWCNHFEREAYRVEYSKRRAVSARIESRPGSEARRALAPSVTDGKTDRR